jgi:hypothetical protein
MGLARGNRPGRTKSRNHSGTPAEMSHNTAELLESKDNETVLKDLGMTKMLRVASVTLRTER